MDPQGQQQQGQQTSWTEFTQETSMHAIRFVHTKHYSTWRRVIWLVLLLGSLSVFGVASKDLLKDFIDKNVSTRMKVVQADQLKMPVITICNRNSLHEGNAVEKARQLNLTLEAVAEVFTTLNRADLLLYHKINWSEPDFQDVAAALSPEVIENLYQEVAHRIDGTFLACSVGGLAKKCSEIVKQVKTTSGFCFELNSDQEITAQAPGLVNGISLMLNADVFSYTTGYATYSEGFYIAFSEQHEVPLVESLSVGAGPGLQTQIMLLKSEISRVPPPADGGKANCYDTLNKPNPLLYYKNYSYSNCITECKTSYVLNRCGCRDPLQPALNGSESCTLPAMLNCSQPANLAFVSDGEGLKSCRCPHPCIESEYTAQVSSYRFPNYKYMSNLGYVQDYNQLAWMRDNVLWVDIYFGKMSITYIEEYLAVDGYGVFANLGGTLGLCIGASLLTFCEFLEFFILFITGLVSKRMNSKKPTLVHPVKLNLEIS